MREGLSEEIKKKALALGYDLCGIIPAESFAEYDCALTERASKFPWSAHFYETLRSMANPAEKAPWAQSVIVCVRRYNKYRIPKGADRFFGKLFLFDGRLSHTEEFAMQKRFEEYLRGCGMKTLRGAVPARLSAVKAGLGKFGRNNFLYTRFGSWVYIETWLVDFELPCDNTPDAEVKPCPPNCRRCIEACPTRALSDAYTMDRGACIAHLSFDSDALPPDDRMAEMGAWIYGCDVCQNVCPNNANRWREEADFPGLEALEALLTPEQILTMDEKTLSEVISPRFWYISKDRLWLWRCNALRAMASNGDSRYHPLIRAACHDENAHVSAAARWACRRLGIEE